MLSLESESSVVAEETFLVKDEVVLTEMVTKEVFLTVNAHLWSSMLLLGSKSFIVVKHAFLVAILGSQHSQAPQVGRPLSSFKVQ